MVIQHCKVGSLFFTSNSLTVRTALPLVRLLEESKDCWSCAQIGSLGRTYRIPPLSIEVRCQRKQLQGYCVCEDCFRPVD